MNNFPADALFESLQARIHQEPKIHARFMGMPTWLRMLFAGAIMLGIIALAWTVFVRPDLVFYPWIRHTLFIYTMLPLALALGGMAIGRLHKPALPTLAYVTTLLASVTLLLLWGGLPEPAIDHPSSLLPDNLFAFQTLACFAVGSVVAAGPWFALRLLDRGAPFAPILAAASAGLIANISLHLHCPFVSRMHIILGHVAIALVYMTAATWLRFRRQKQG